MEFHLPTIFFAAKDATTSDSFEEKVVARPDRVSLEAMANLIKEGATKGEIEPRSARMFLRAYGNFYLNEMVDITVNAGKGRGFPREMERLAFDKSGDELQVRQAAVKEARVSLKELNQVRFTFTTLFVSMNKRNAAAEKLIQLIYGHQMNLERFSSEFPESVPSFQKTI